MRSVDRMVSSRASRAPAKANKRRGNRGKANRVNKAKDNKDNKAKDSRASKVRDKDNRDNKVRAVAKASNNHRQMVNAKAKGRVKVAATDNRWGTAARRTAPALHVEALRNSMADVYHPMMHSNSAAKHSNA
jgi:hypothetical protein